jgi:hypothetical protein
MLFYNIVSEADFNITKGLDTYTQLMACVVELCCINQSNHILLNT